MRNKILSAVIVAATMTPTLRSFAAPVVHEENPQDITPIFVEEDDLEQMRKQRSRAKLKRRLLVAGGVVTTVVAVSALVATAAALEFKYNGKYGSVPVAGDVGGERPDAPALIVPRKGEGASLTGRFLMWSHGDRVLDRMGHQVNAIWEKIWDKLSSKKKADGKAGDRLAAANKGAEGETGEEGRSQAIAQQLQELASAKSTLEEQAQGQLSEIDRLSKGIKAAEDANSATEAEYKKLEGKLIQTEYQLESAKTAVAAAEKKAADAEALRVQHCADADARCLQLTALAEKARDEAKILREQLSAAQQIVAASGNDQLIALQEQLIVAQQRADATQHLLEEEAARASAARTARVQFEQDVANLRARVAELEGTAAQAVNSGNPIPADASAPAPVTAETLLPIDVTTTTTIVAVRHNAVTDEAAPSVLVAPVEPAPVGSASNPVASTGSGVSGTVGVAKSASDSNLSGAPAAEEGVKSASDSNLSSDDDDTKKSLSKTAKRKIARGHKRNKKK